LSGDASKGDEEAMTTRPTIALVHKERNLLTSIGIAFEAAGFEVRTYDDGQAALEALSAAPADIGILGRTLPRLYGPDLFVRLRKSTRMPVIFLSSHGDDLADEVQGADDYLATGVSSALLVDRARMILRRGRDDGLVLDSDRRQCIWRRTRVYLNMPEFLMIEAMAKNGVCTRFALMEAAYGPAVEMDEEVVDGHIAAMQRKFRRVDASVVVIEPISGVAYRLGKWV
jgi:two-component system response regulator ChvI